MTLTKQLIASSPTGRARVPFLAAMKTRYILKDQAMHTRYVLCAVGLMAVLFWSTLPVMADETTSTLSSAAAIDEQLSSLAEKLATQLSKKKLAKVAAIDFRDIQGRPNELGRYLAEMLSVELVLVDGITVVDRANIEAIMEEHELTAEGLVKPENAKKLGQFAGVDVILIGNIATIGERVTVIVKGISTESTEVVTAGRMRINRTQELAKMLGEKVDDNSGNRSAVTGPTSPDTKAIAKRQIGPLHATLTQVRSSTINTEHGPVPGLTCSFIIDNRRLDETAVIAAVQAVEERGPSVNNHPRTVGYRGSITDNIGQKWTITKTGLRGVSSVYSLEMAVSGQNNFVSTITQNSPAAIVDYIRRGTYYDPTLHKTGIYWGGGFTEIGPGSETRITISMVPQEFSGKRYPRDPQFKQPDSLQIDFELVVGTIEGKQEPKDSRNLAVCSLTIEEIFLSQSLRPGA